MASYWRFIAIYCTQMQRARDPSQCRIYRLERKDEYGRDVFKNVEDAELALINGTELGWAKKIIKAACH
jgi:hypothetical protein